MPYCTKCGQALQEGNRFCANCGTPVSAAPQPSNPPPTPQPPQPPQPSQPSQQPPAQPDQFQARGYAPASGQPIQMKKTNPALPLLITGAAVVVAVIVFALVVRALLNRNEVPSESAEASWNSVPFVEEEPEQEPYTDYESYENGEVGFSLEYPAEAVVEELNPNNVLIGQGDDFRLAVEFSAYTAGRCLIYSAEDFAGMIEADPQVLLDWVGSQEVVPEPVQKTALAGRECWEYPFSWDTEQGLYTGGLYLLDSGGEYGCYSLQWLVNTESPDADLYISQVDHALESLEVKASYTPDGSELIELKSGQVPVRCVIREDLIGNTDNGTGKNDMVWIYPIEGVFTESCISFWPTDHKASDSVESVLEDCCSYYLKKDGAEFTSRVTEVDMGRYDYTEIDMAYQEKGIQFRYIQLVFPYEGYYWNLHLNCSEEYYDSSITALQDVLASLKLGGNQAVSSTARSAASKEESLGLNTVLRDVLSEVESREGFRTDDCAPLVSVTDADGDGNWEVIALYQAKSGNDFLVQYEVWNVCETGAKQLATGDLYQEVGGNSGSVGIATKDGTVYLVIDTKSPQGDRFNNMTMFVPLKAGGDGFGQETYYYESHGTYGEEEKGQYIAGDTKVDKSRYDALIDKFVQLTTVNLYQGPDGGSVTNFEQAKESSFQ